MLSFKSMAQNKKNIANHTYIKFLILLSICIALSFLPVSQDLSIEGRNTLLIILFAVMLWITELISPALTSLLLMTLLSLFKIMPFDKAVGGLGNTLTWLLLGVFIISAAMHETGLDKRIALHLLQLAKGSSVFTLLMIIITTTFFIFLLPTSAGRAAIMTPICLGLTQSMDLKPGSNFAKSLFIAVSFTSFIGAIGVMTGALSMVYAAELFALLTNYIWDYKSWLIALFPSALIINFLLWPTLLKVFPPEVSHIAGGTQYIKGELHKLGKISIKEQKILVLILIMIMLWIFEDVVQMSVAQSCLLIAVITMLPGIEVISWKKAMQSVEWGVVLLVAASLSMVEALTSTQAIDWLAKIIFSPVNHLHPLLLGFSTLIILGFVRVGFPNLLSMTAATFPIIISIAISANINPVWLGLISINASVLGIFLPTQSITHLTTYATGYYAIKDMSKAGFFASLIIIIVTMLMATIYWPLLGIHYLSP